MTLLQTMLRIEWLRLRRGPLLGWLAGLLVVAGLYAIVYGHTELSRQRATMTALQQDEQARVDSLRAALSLDTTRADNLERWQKARDPYVVDAEGYRFASHPPGPLMAFSLGQRDLFPTYQSVKATSLLNQLDPTELANPEKLLVGNFDLAFVLVYLLPLFIIALCYNALSAETELGTLPLLQTQPVDIRYVVGSKLLLRLLVVLGLAVALVGVGAVVVGVSDGGLLLKWLLVTVAYTLFWFALVGLVLAFGWSSATNALVLLGTWLTLVLVVPALVQQVVALTRPLPDYQGLQSQLREVYNNRPPKAVSLAAFYERHPELANSDTTDADRYLFMSYYARNEVIDRQFAAHADSLAQQAAQYSALSAGWLGLMPAVNAQRLFNQLAGTDETARQTYLAQLARFHADWKAFIIPRKFRGQAMTLTDYAQLPTFRYVPAPPAPIGAGVGWLLLTTLLLGGLAWWRLGQTTRPL